MGHLSTLHFQREEEIESSGNKLLEISFSPELSTSAARPSWQKGVSFFGPPFDDQFAALHITALSRGNQDRRGRQRKNRAEREKEERSIRDARFGRGAWILDGNPISRVDEKTSCCGGPRAGVVRDNLEDGWMGGGPRSVGCGIKMRDSSM